MQALSSPSNQTAGELVATPALTFTRDQLELLKRTIARGTTDDEFALFLEACKRRRMDPFSKLIYPVKRWDKTEQREIMALQSSIDAFRLVADRSSSYAGQVGPHWCGKDGQWRDVWLDSEPPAAARVGVHKAEFKEPLFAIALWSNYAQRDKQGNVTRFWKNMGPLMLAKCAEALALRRAFPEDLAGLYTSDEMHQAVTPEEPPRDQIEQLAEADAPRPAVKRASNGREIVWEAGKGGNTKLADELKAEREAVQLADATATATPGPTGEVFPWEYKPRVFLDLVLPPPPGSWESWRDTELPTGKLKRSCIEQGRPATWRTAAQGTKGGGRAAMLLHIVTTFQKLGKPAEEAPIEYRKAAAALAILIAGIELEQGSESQETPLFEGQEQ